MKKILSMICTLTIMSNFTCLSVSCNLFPHSQLNMDISKWDIKSITEKNVNLQQAISAGKSKIYLNPNNGSTPFIKSDGSYASIHDVIAKDWPGGNSTNPNSNEPLEYYQLDYVIPSFIAYYQKKAKHKTNNTPLINLESFKKNFDVVYYYGIPSNTEEKLGVSMFPDSSGKLPLDKTKQEIKEYKHVSIGNGEGNTVKVMSHDIFSKNDLANKNGGYAAGMYYGGSSASNSNESIYVAFNFDLIIKPDHYKTIIQNGKSLEIPVSKDGYYSSDTLLENLYISSQVVISFYMSTPF